MPEMEFFPQRPQARPTIYAYNYKNANQGYIKVGYTDREVETRVKEQTHTAGMWSQTQILGSWSAMKNDGTNFTDDDVRAVLLKKGIRQLNAGEDRNEWYKCDLSAVKAAVLSVQTGSDNEENRIYNFPISSLDIVENMDKIIMFEGKEKLTNAKKLMKIKNSPVLKMDKKVLIRRLKTLPRYKDKIKIKNNKIQINTNKDVIELLKILNDDYLISELTDKSYESSAKVLEETA